LIKTKLKRSFFQEIRGRQQYQPQAKAAVANTVRGATSPLINIVDNKYRRQQNRLMDIIAYPHSAKN
jgi:hypothetical protein